jgi:hypothetical protein
MTIRRINKAGKTNLRPVSTGNNATAKVGAGEDFAQQLAHVAGANGVETVEGVAPIKTVNDATSHGSKNERREQMEQTGELLETLEVLGENLDPSILIKDGNDDLARQRLKETRDQALRTLSGTPAHSEERELLHRTALLATVELAKSERGDYK